MPEIISELHIPPDHAKEIRFYVEACPFCGGEEMDWKQYVMYCYIFCEKCDAQGPLCSDIKPAIEAWNYRVS